MFLGSNSILYNNILFQTILYFVSYDDYFKCNAANANATFSVKLTEIMA